MTADRITRILCDPLNVRIYTAVTRAVSTGLARIHRASPAVALALSRMASATALLGAALKPDSDQTVSMKISGSGPVRELHVQADARGNLRGYAGDPSADCDISRGRMNIGELIGAGFLTVIRDLGLKEPYTSVQPLVRGEIAYDVAYYLTVSEQVPSALILGTAQETDGTFSASGGILIQGLPGTSPETLEKIEANIAGMKAPLGERLKGGEDIVSATAQLVDGAALEILGSTPLALACRCSREMLAQVIRGISPDDIGSMLEKDHGIELTCTFCTTRYRFEEREIRALFAGRLNA